MRGLLLELLAALKQWDRQGGPSQPITPLIGGIAERLASHARERYDHRWLGEWSSYHPDHIARQFRRSSALRPTISSWAASSQLAKDLLAHSELPLLSVADELEAGSIHNFTKWFKQHTGVPPGKFRSRSRFI